MNCKVGLVSFPKINYYNIFPIYLAECNKNDIEQLNNLHRSLNYLSEFKITIIKNNILINNYEDIKYIKNKYNLTSEVKYKHIVNDVEIEYKKPILYDLNCNIPLFKYNFCIKKQIIKPISEYKKVFIILPYKNPMIRGKIIDECIKNTLNHDPIFFLVVGIKGKNKISICDLSEKYLLSQGIKMDNIVKQEEDDYPDCILDCLTILELYGIDKYILHVGLLKKHITDALLNFRKLKNTGLIYKKIYFISN